MWQIWFIASLLVLEMFTQKQLKFLFLFPGPSKADHDGVVSFLRTEEAVQQGQPVHDREDHRRRGHQARQ